MVKMGADPSNHTFGGILREKKIQVTPVKQTV